MKRTDQEWCDHVSMVMRSTLQLAIPLWVERVKRWHPSERSATAGRCGQVIAEKGDVLQFGSKKKGEQARVFNDLACGLACLAFCPGGVTFLGDHWEVKRRKTPPSPPKRRKKSRRRKGRKGRKQPPPPPRHG